MPRKKDKGIISSELVAWNPPPQTATEVRLMRDAYAYRINGGLMNEFIRPRGGLLDYTEQQLIDELERRGKVEKLGCQFSISSQQMQMLHEFELEKHTRYMVRQGVQSIAERIESEVDFVKVDDAMNFDAETYRGVIRIIKQ